MGWCGTILKATNGGVTFIEHSISLNLNNKEFTLHQNYPNPFNPSTTMEYQLPVQGIVTINIYNSLGEMVKTLVNEQKDAGYYSAVWDGKNEFNQQVPSGVYIYQIKSGSFMQSRKMLMLK